GARRTRWRIGRNHDGPGRWLGPRSWLQLHTRIGGGGVAPPCSIPRDLRDDPAHPATRFHPQGQTMKITEIRTRVVQWEGKTVPLPPHFCTNPMDLVAFREASMGNFAFHNWLLVEIFTDSGLVGIGNAALSPMVTKQLIDIYLKPLLIGADPWDIEYLWQQMYRRTLAFGRKGVALTAISAVDIALWDLLGKG